jgi:hypothetical protein
MIAGAFTPTMPSPFVVATTNPQMAVGGGCRGDPDDDARQQSEGTGLEPLVGRRLRKAERGSVFF